MRFLSRPLRYQVGVLLLFGSLDAFAQRRGVEEVVVEASAPPTMASEPATASELESATEGNGEATETPAAAPAATASDGDSETKREIERLRQERERIAAENALAAERNRQQLADLEAEKQRLQLENSLRSERLNAEVAETRTRLDRLALETEAINKQTAYEAAKRRSELDQELAEMRAEEERNRLANSIASQKSEAKLNELRLLESDYKARRAEFELEVLRLQTELSVREKSEVLRDLAPLDPVYTAEPFVDGVLTISDRRIDLNGVIVHSVANRIAERIDYFNNQDSKNPIFVVIDSSPGGSVMAGDKIIRSMQGSRAPVYVVVKSYAASMAAVITAASDRSFAYPNAVLIHHQIAWFGIGNLTQQREQLQAQEQWWRRLAQPVAARMGLTLDQFIAEMYKKNSDGDWREFADVAVKLKWIDSIVTTIRETSVDKNPDRFRTEPTIYLSLEEKRDERGEPYVILPRLQPHDCYFLHNPDGYFRMR